MESDMPRKDAEQKEKKAKDENNIQTCSRINSTDS